MINNRYGRLVVQSVAGTGPRGTSWNCLCDCGKTVVLNTYKLTKDSYASCGCGRTDWSWLTDKGDTAVYKANWLTATSWNSMFNRCVRHVNEECCYAKISICERWYSFANFLADMGPRPSREYCIDRIDPDKDYEPGNCRWILKTENAARIRLNLSEERNRRVSEGIKKAHEEGKILTPETRRKIGLGGVKREGRKLQKCEECGANSYLPKCQRCRGLRKPL